MQSIKDKLKTKKFQVVNDKATWFSEWSKEATAYFGKNCFWMPYKYEKWKLYEKFKAIKTEGKKDLNYFIGMLK
jgi:hypothetical protein